MYRLLSFVALLVALCKAQDIYGITSQNELVAFNSTDGTGQWTLVGRPFADPSDLRVLIQAADIDDNGQNFYTIAVDEATFSLHLVGVNISTGQISSQVDLPFILTRNFVNTPGVDFVSGSEDVLVYGLIGQDNGQNQFQILRITPSTNTTAIVATFDSDLTIQSVDAFDPTANWLWIQAESNNENVLMAIDITSGAVGYNATDDFDLQNLNYDNALQTVVGISSPEDDFNNIYSWNTTTTSWTVYSAMRLGYGLDITGPSNCGLNADEGTSGTLFCYLQSTQNFEVQFLAIDVESGDSTALTFDPDYSTYPITIASFPYE